MSTLWRASGGLVNSIKLYNAHRNKSGLSHGAMRKFARAKHLVLSILTSSDLGIGVQFGEGLNLPHPTGIVIHPEVVIGSNCMIMQQVTIGQLSGEGVPVIGSNVYIGAGAKILGPITIGDGAKIGANAVVLNDVPPGSTAVGVPSKVVRRH